MTGERRIPAEERRERVARRQLVAAGTCEEVVGRLVALHATDPATVFLSVAARLREPAAATEALEAALYGPAHTLTRMLAMRRTMFVVTRQAAPAVFAAAGRQVAVQERKGLLGYLAEGGGWDEKWLAEVEAEVEQALAEHGACSGAQLSRLVPRLREQVVVARGKPYEATQNVASRIIRTIAAEGRIERRRPAGSWTSSQFRWAKAEPLPEQPVDKARAEVAGAWLAAYGPGTEADLKWWTGWSLTEVRRALVAVGAERVTLDEGPGYVMPGDVPGETSGEVSGEVSGGAPADVPGGAAAGPAGTEPAEPAARLLPALDPTAMGWQDRDWFLPRSHRAALFDRSGNVGPTVWWGGEVIGGWAQRADGTVVWRQLTDRGAQAAGAVEREAAGLTARLAGVRITPRFRTPLERELSTG